MAIVQNVYGISKLFPKPSSRFYMGIITHTDEYVALSSLINAIVVNNETKKVENNFRVVCSLMTVGNIFYLYFHKQGEKILDNNYHIRVVKNVGKEPISTDWPFKKDNIGLYAEVGYFKEKRIYFTTSCLDLKDIKEALNKETTKEEHVACGTVVTETVYI